MSRDFEAVYKGSENIKRMMQGVYNTFTEKFGFQPMTLPELDLDPMRTRLKLLIHQTDDFVKDPVNVVVKVKSIVVKNFYNSLVKEARRTFTDAKTQTERWMQAVTLPLEVQIKDHKAQLQSRLDNLGKINEKTSTINEQMAQLREVGQDLRKQREMIDGLILRVSQHQARAGLQGPAAVAAAPSPASTPPPAAKAAAAPPAAAIAQKLPPGAERTQKMGAAAPPLDLDLGAGSPAVAQKMPAAAGGTQRSDDSISRLQEAKRILQGVRGK
jgi:hypothetical protein